MTPGTPTLNAFCAAGASDPGLLRDVNEDRFYLDPARGIFVVVDGVGGQAAGGKAADIALTALKSGLSHESGNVERRIRNAITAANNEIHRTAALRPQWNGMACVLTAVVIDQGRAFVGHVGDTRLYKLRGGSIQKVTRDHSPVGEREDQGELSEAEAMNHPRRHEVYRDVGSDRHAPIDEDFVDVYEIAFEPDAALLLCSDGLTDLVPSSVLRHVVAEFAGQATTIVKRLIDAANDAGGKDNITVVYVEGDRFAERTAQAVGARSEITRRRTTTVEAAPATVAPANVADATRPRTTGTRAAMAAVLTFLAVAGLVVTYPQWSAYIDDAVPLPPVSTSPIVVQPTGSIAAALQRAQPGSQVIVEPGEYRERLVLRSGVLVVSRIPRGAILRLPGGAGDADPAVIASGVSGAGLIGFRIVGDAATPLGTGVLVADADVSVIDVDISGAANVAVDVRNGARINLVGSVIQGNPGAALALAAGSVPRIAHNVFSNNGTSDRIAGSVLIDGSVDAEFSGNVFHGVSRNAFAALSESARTRLGQQNVFVEAVDPRTRSTAQPRGGRGR